MSNINNIILEISSNTLGNINLGINSSILAVLLGAGAHHLYKKYKHKNDNKYVTLNMPDGSWHTHKLLPDGTIDLSNIHNDYKNKYRK